MCPDSDRKASSCKYCIEEDVCEFYSEDRAVCRFDELENEEPTFEDDQGVVRRCSDYY
jgi:hypothetical protein